MRYDAVLRMTSIRWEGGLDRTNEVFVDARAGAVMDRAGLPHPVTAGSTAGTVAGDPADLVFRVTDGALRLVGRI